MTRSQASFRWRPGHWAHSTSDHGADQLTGYIFRRFAQSVVVLLLVTVIMFIMFHLLPGQPGSG